MGFGLDLSRPGTSPGSIPQLKRKPSNRSELLRLLPRTNSARHELRTGQSAQISVLGTHREVHYHTTHNPRRAQGVSSTGAMPSRTGVPPCLLRQGTL